ncbi:hypothetical protein FB451DRAFT_762753 [Mycena latifolia]|nr:hypothetical protein FB451DRAFT_762753 [Mycena latifolia]
MSRTLHTPTNFDAHIPDLVMAFAILAIAAIVLTLGGYAWAAWNPVSRPHLNRVSFRLLVYALVANLLYAVSMIGGTRLTAGAACNFNAFAANSVLMFAGVMFASMAINLQLVLVHGVNGQKMERYYVLTAVAMTAACNVSPYAAGALGFWEANSTCWFNSPNPAVQLRWFIGSQAFWLFLISTCEVISFLTIVGYMIIRHRLSSAISGSATSSFPRPPTIPKPPIVLYRTIIIRIGLYPLISCFFTITGCILDLHQVQDPEMTEVNWRWGIVDLLVYSLRPMMYAFLAATDPSFLRALRALRRPASETPLGCPPQRHPQKKTEDSWSSSLTSSAGWIPGYCDAVGGDALTAEGSTSVDNPDFTHQI